MQNWTCTSIILKHKMGEVGFSFFKNIMCIFFSFFSTTTNKKESKKYNSRIQK